MGRSWKRRSSSAVTSSSSAIVWPRRWKSRPGRRWPRRVMSKFEQSMKGIEAGLAEGSRNSPPDQVLTKAPIDAASLLEGVVDEQGARIVANLIGACGGDFQLAEDVFQEALIAALQHWPAEGVPQQPAGWIVTTARRKAIDQLRRDQTLARKREQLEYLMAQEQMASARASGEREEDVLEDDRLRLIFTS